MQVFEAMLMLVIVGASISEYPHYHNYYLIAFLANMAWLAAALGWMSAASLWNPFLPEGPPLGLPTATLHPGRTPGRPARDEEEEECPGTEWRPHEGWGGDTPAPARGVKSIGGALAAAAPRGGEGAIAASIDAGGVFSPIGPKASSAASSRDARRAGRPRGSSVVRSRRRIAGNAGTTRRKGAPRLDTGILPVTTVDPEPVSEASPRALNFTSVPEDFKYDFAAERAKRLAAAKAQQEAAARAGGPARGASQDG